MHLLFVKSIKEKLFHGWIDLGLTQVQAQVEISNSLLCEAARQLSHILEREVVNLLHELGEEIFL